MYLGKLLLTSLTTLLSLATLALADGTSDFTDLQALITSATTQIQSTLNVTQATNTVNGTSDLLSRITGAIMASRTSLDSDQVAYVNGSTVPMDGPYLNYIGAISSFASAITAQGHAWHTQMNAPVYSGLQALATAMHSLSSDLASKGLISQTATIRTIRAGSAVVDAESVWDQPLNYPGRRRRVFFV